ncbi:MAG: hypothetical protein IAF08_10300 [Rhizobacter sp.]|nr:hypothetical protein [Chlorobiales bacterium]
MDILLSGYFDGLLDIDIEPVRGEEPMWRYIRPDVRVMVWQALQMMNESDVQKWFARKEEIVVRHSQAEMNQAHFRYDKIASCVLLYFYHREKTVASFLNDISIAKDCALFRTLLCHAAVGNLELSHRELSPSFAAMSASNASAQNRTPIRNIQKASGLRKILSAIKNI